MFMMAEEGQPLDTVRVQYQLADICNIHFVVVSYHKHYYPLMQVSRVSAPWLRTIVLDDTDDGNYVIPNIESVVVGGTHQTGDWDTVISYGMLDP